MPLDTVPLPPRPKRVSRGRILAVVLIYAMFAAGWILLSDKLVQILFTNPEQIILVSMVKGWLFVAATSLLLYGLIQRMIDVDTEPTTSPADVRQPAWPFVLLMVTVIICTVPPIINIFTDRKKEQITRLQTIAELKSRQIADWLSERQHDADLIQSSDFLAEQYRDWQKSSDLHNPERLQIRLEQLLKNQEADAVILLNPRAEKLWESNETPPTLAPPLQAAAQFATTTHQVQRVGPYRDTNGNASLDFIVPLTAIPGPAPLVILHIDLSARLSTLLQNWPEPNVGSEILLFRLDGDKILLLNKLQHPQQTGLSVTTEQLLTSQALRNAALPGKPVTGVDYRGIPVIGVVHAIVGADWLLVAKLDQSELYANAIGEAAWIGLVGILALFITGTGFYLMRQTQQLALSQAVQQSQAERLSALNLLATIADSSDDAIFAKDLDGRYILFNRAAGLFVGKSVEEMLGRDDRDIFPSQQADMLMAFGRRVIAENRIISQEESLDTLQGERVFLATKGPLYDGEGKTIGIFGISRDITERKQAEAALHASELSYRSLFENMMNSVVHARIIFQGETPTDLEYISANPAFATVTGITEPVIGRRVSEIIPGYCENNPESIKVFWRVATTGVSTRWEHYLRELNRWFSFMIYSPCYGEVIIVTENITERKQAELALRDSEGRFRALVEQSLAGIYIIQDGRFRYVNPGFAAIFGYDSPEALIDSVPVTDLVRPEERERVAENVRQRIDGEVAAMHYIVACLRRDGSRIDVEAHGRAFDYQGRPAVIGFIINISERKTAEALLRVSEERLQLALDATRDGLWDLDLRSGLAYLTPHYYEITGYRPDQVTPDAEFLKRTVHPDDLAQVLETMKAHLQGKTPSCEFDYRLMTPSGEIKWIRGRGRVVERDATGTALRMVGTITDISAHKDAEETLHKQTQELAQRNEELERFNRATVGRELDMIALKQQVNELSRQLGQEPVYPLAFLNAQSPQQKKEGSQ
ncbi:MAG: PAS domain S-box protein [Methylobacter sp.]|nr:MAG: PAS domain S-box protein [Methylobacter sp.]